MEDYPIAEKASKIISIHAFHPRCQIKALATPILRGEAELRGEGRDCLEPVRRRVKPTTPPRAMEIAPRKCVTDRPGLLARRAEVELIIRVHVQDLDGRPTDGGFANDVDSLEGKVSLPSLLARVEQLGDRAGERVNARQVGTFAEVAVDAREAEVRFIIGAAVLVRADVLDVEDRERRVILMQVAILAAVRGPLAHKGSRRLRHDAALAFMVWASRRRVATNLLART